MWVQDGAGSKLGDILILYVGGTNSYSGGTMVKAWALSKGNVIHGFRDLPQENLDTITCPTHMKKCALVGVLAITTLIKSMVKISPDITIGWNHLASQVPP